MCFAPISISCLRQMDYSATSISTLPGTVKKSPNVLLASTENKLIVNNDSGGYFTCDYVIVVIIDCGPV